MFFSALLLRTDHQEIENDEDQNKRDKGFKPPPEPPAAWAYAGEISIERLLIVRLLPRNRWSGLEAGLYNGDLTFSIGKWQSFFFATLLPNQLG